MISTAEREADDQDEADDSQLAQRLQIEAVRVADDARVAAVASPPELERPRADPGQRLGLVGVDGRLPELVAPRPADVQELVAARLRRSRGLRLLASAGPPLNSSQRSESSAGNPAATATRGGDQDDRDRGARQHRPRDPQPARAFRVSGREADSDLGERHPGADQEDEQLELTALSLRGRGVSPRSSASRCSTARNRSVEPAAAISSVTSFGRRSGARTKKIASVTASSPTDSPEAVSQIVSATIGSAAAASPWTDRRARRRRRPPGRAGRRSPRTRRARSSS